MPVRALAIGFMLLLGVSVALSIQIVGALLVLALLITPAAAAMRVTSSPRLVVILSVVFAVTATVGGILLALGGRIPISPYVTTLSFLIYVVCRVIGGDPGQARPQRPGAAQCGGAGRLSRRQPGRPPSGTFVHHCKYAFVQSLQSCNS